MGVLEGQVAIVTGGGQGVGRGVALAVAAEGAKVLVLGRTSAKCEAVVAEIRARGGEASAQECDVEHRDQVEASVQRAVELWGRIDLLVNNAQTMVYRSLRRMTEADMETMWQSGPMGALRFMQACFPTCVRAKVVWSTWVPARRCCPTARWVATPWRRKRSGCWPASAPSNGAGHGIRVVAICPLAATPGLDEFGDSTPGAVDTVLSTIPLGRWGDPERDIGRAVVYLAGPDGRYVTGTTLMVDGGFNYLR